MKTIAYCLVALALSASFSGALQAQQQSSDAARSPMEQHQAELDRIREVSPKAAVPKKIRWVTVAAVAEHFARNPEWCHRLETVGEGEDGEIDGDPEFREVIDHAMFTSGFNYASAMRELLEHCADARSAIQPESSPSKSVTRLRTTG